MKTKERLDKVMVGCCSRIQEEVSALLGKKFNLGEPQTKVVSKEDFFAESGGKSVLAHVQMEGDLEGQGGLLVAIKDAIRIGGTLIMLPDSELENVAAEGDYTEEIQDSYGEIANIVCGSITSTFEEQYPKNFRVVRTEQEVIVPAKLDMASDQPLPAAIYYVMSAAMRLGDLDLGSFNILLPAAPFGLAERADVPEKEPSAQAGTKEEPARETTATGSGEGFEQLQAGSRDDHQEGAIGSVERPAAESASTPEAVPAGKRPKRDSGKQQKLIDGLLKNCLAKVGEEAGSLLGGSLKVLPAENQLLSKAGLLEQVGGKQAMVRMQIRGETTGEAYLLVDIRGAIRLGGSLIMLPESELEETVRAEKFGEDAQDAFGEITNIIAGVYTAVFEEQYRQKLGFVKTSVETLVAVKVDPDSDEALPNQLYYLSGGQLLYNEKDLGRLQMVIPAAVLELEDLLQPEEEEPGAVDQAPERADVSGSGAVDRNERPQATGGGQRGEGSVDFADILLFSDQDSESAGIAAVLTDLGYSPRILRFKDQVHANLTPAVQLVFLVMSEVNEQGFGVAIKLSSAGLAVPLVAGGPAWTRSLVLKAVKYGVSDILVTPASPEDIREKVEMNLAKIAA